MTQDAPERRFFHANFQKNLLAGLLTIIPLVVVWVVFDFFLALLSPRRPAAGRGHDRFRGRHLPAVAPWLADERVRAVIAILIALLALYTIGAIASRVIGVKLIGYFERLIERIPFVQTIYSATKKLVTVLQQKPDGTARVVLIEFPHPGMHAIGFVMRVMKDAGTRRGRGRRLCADHAQPDLRLSGDRAGQILVPTDMTMDQAMTMIISGGAISPDVLHTGRTGAIPAAVPPGGGAALKPGGCARAPGSVSSDPGAARRPDARRGRLSSVGRATDL